MLLFIYFVLNLMLHYYKYILSWIIIKFGNFFYIFASKIVSMIRKYHNHKLQTTPWHREEEPLNHQNMIFLYLGNFGEIHNVTSGPGIIMPP